MVCAVHVMADVFEVADQFPVELQDGVVPVGVPTGPRLKMSAKLIRRIRSDAITKSEIYVGRINGAGVESRVAAVPRDFYE
jgi:hypothetical protein